MSVLPRTSSAEDRAEREKTRSWKKAVVYVAGGSNYAIEAETSRNSVRTQMPGMECILATDSRDDLGGWDQVLRMSGRKYPEQWYHDSCRYYNEALARLADYDMLVFLDTDTFCAWPFWELYEVLEHFDIVGTHGIARHTAPTFAHLSDAFPELCIGMLAVRNNERTRQLLREWLALYDAHPNVYGNNDQGPLREALWNNREVRLYVATPEYHCRWGFGAYVAGMVRILHCRNADQAEVAKQINDGLGGMRLYRPYGLVFRAGYGDIG